MTITFSDVALNRIAKVVQIPMRDGTPQGALEFIGQVLEVNATTFVDVELLPSYGSDEEPLGVRLLSFAGFVELAVQSGYVHLPAL